MLRQLRNDAGKTRDDAADWLEVQAPTVSKIELGKQAIKPPSVRLLCTLYGADAGTTNTLVELARAANQRGWWTQYRETTPEYFLSFVGQEADAATIWSYQSEWVPGQLQTAAYVEASTRALKPDLSEEQLAQRVEFRMKRQEEVNRDDPPEMKYFLNESILRRPVGGADVMREQLERLVEASRADHVSIRVVPFAAGAHTGMFGSFVMLQFPDEDVPGFVYVENLQGAVYQDTPADVEAYTVGLSQLDAVALDQEGSRAMIANAAGAL
ncbi:helix-turn-helix transcriptional regulator [Saccharopolyspora sp. ID03-671]|uniref:helix-turn-helix domain-containing protein n=1 Tax=Saccharopolyspora sp. ID03-671 TaxID=3073066 RepID=UPI00324A34DB